MFQAEDLIAGFRAHGGWLDTNICRLQPVEGMGIGLIAVEDIPAHKPLFHIPNSYILSPSVTDLKLHLSSDEWDSLSGGWDQLILEMMWEEAKGEASIWAAYFKNMPRTFRTPMFWSAEDLKGLIGTDIEHRIGRSDAEGRYAHNLLPILQAHPSLFPPSSAHFSLDAFHMQGSRILSRSFTIPVARSSDDSEDEEDEEIAVMIPMADMLNAAHERDNVHLFNNEDDDDAITQQFSSGYTMISTKDIKKGEQIYNTYASPPNNELLRKYGHVEIFPLSSISRSLLLPEDIVDWPYGNDADEVDVPGSLIVEAVSRLQSKTPTSLVERVDLWLEEGQDDSFPLALSSGFDPGLVSFIRLLIYDSDWQRLSRKGKLPSHAMDPGVAGILGGIAESRLACYDSTLKLDTASLSIKDNSSPKYMAAVVRVSEKRILEHVKRASLALMASNGKILDRAAKHQRSPPSAEDRPKGRVCR